MKEGESSSMDDEDEEDLKRLEFMPQIRAK
jgi:hypothetical protein